MYSGKFSHLNHAEWGERTSLKLCGKEWDRYYNGPLFSNKTFKDILKENVSTKNTCHHMHNHTHTHTQKNTQERWLLYKESLLLKIFDQYHLEQNTNRVVLARMKYLDHLIILDKYLLGPTVMAVSDNRPLLNRLDLYNWYSTCIIKTII